MLVPMTKVEIIGPKKYLYDIIGFFHQLGVIHIQDMSNKIRPGDMLVRRMEADEESTERRRELENLSIKINSIISSLATEETIKAVSQGEKEKYYFSFWSESCDELKSEVNNLIKKLEEETRELATLKDKLELEQVTMARYETIFGKIKPLAKQLVSLKGFETVALLFDRKYKSILDEIRSDLSRITRGQFEVISTDVDEETTAALVVFNNRFSELVNSSLWSKNVSQVRLPEELSEMSFEEAFLTVRERRAKLPSELVNVKEKLSKISREWLTKLLAIRDVLNDRLREFQVVYQFGQTDYTFIIEGWIPRRFIKKTQAALRKEFGERVIVNEVKVSEHELEEAPVVMENPKWAKPFEILMGLLQTPRYGTVDPTPFIAVFFPIFFGMMLGDVGYGLLTALIAYWLRKKYRSPFVQSAGQIMYMCAASSVLFGFIYGEFFGNLVEIVFHRLHWPFFKEIIGIRLPLNRMELIKPMLALAIGVGFGHIILGLVLGVVNAIREKAKRHIFENIGMIITLCSFILLIVAAKKLLPNQLMTPAVVFLIIGLVLLIYGGGLMGLIHIFGTFSNILSYARIMAIGLSSVVLAMVANKFGGMGGNIALGILLAGIFHALALVLGIFSPTIHALRLHLVEFYGKFYQGGGKPYLPFRRTGGENIG